MDGLHVEGMTEDKRDALVGTEVGEPVPGEHAFDSDDETLVDTGQWPSEGLRVGFHVTVHQNLAAWSRMQTYMVRACRSMPQ